MSESVVVTGAAGFIGIHLVRRLAEQDIRVIAADVKPEPPAFQGASQIRYIQGDFGQSPALSSELQGVRTVYHLASKHLEVGVPDREFRRVNVESLGPFAKECAQQGVETFVYVSSVGVYGHVSEPPADEEAPTKPGNIYEITKLEAEKAAVELAKSLGMKLIIVRPSWVYGPGCPRTAKLISSLAGRKFFFVGQGRNLRHPIYIEDAIHGMEVAARADRSLTGRIYNIAGPEWMSLADMIDRTARTLDLRTPTLNIPRTLALPLFKAVEMVFSTLGRQPPVSRRSLAFFENDNAFDIRRAQEELGFQPRIQIEEGMRYSNAG